MPTYRKALAAYFEERYTSRYIDVATERSDDPVARPAVLRSLVVEEKESEVALKVAATVSLGIRNFVDPEAALVELARVVRSGAPWPAHGGAA